MPTAKAALTQHQNLRYAMELNTARVFVRDIDAAKQFYSSKLGLPLNADGSQYGYCVFKAGSTELVLEVVADDAPEEDRILVGRFTGLSFTVQDIEEKHRQLVALGVPFTGAPEKQFWGGILATLQDPSGNELQIVQRPTAA
jgi:predicted enzyme related to lactoylglutathione lyase